MEFKSDEYRSFLLDNFPNAKIASGGKEVCCKCWNCDDHSRHMYFNIPEDDITPLFYSCRRCPAKGIVTTSLLRNLGIRDEYIFNLIDTYSKAPRFHNNKMSKRSINLSNLNVIYDNEKTKRKLDYLYDRLGHYYSIEECHALKIIPNLKDFLYANHINNLTRDERIVDALNEYFVGFLSMDNCFIILRRIIDEGNLFSSIDKRYIIYNIFNHKTNPEANYTIPVNIEFPTARQPELHIAEGPFDILSIYNLRNRVPAIYTTIVSNTYLQYIQRILFRLMIPRPIIHLYPDNTTEKDNSGDDEHMKSLTDYFKKIGIKIIIHRNIMEEEKDFGVRPERIKEVIYEL